LVCCNASWTAGGGVSARPGGGIVPRDTRSGAGRRAPARVLARNVGGELRGARWRGTKESIFVERRARHALRTQTGPLPVALASTIEPFLTRWPCILTRFQIPPYNAEAQLRPREIVQRLSRCTQ
jgi:hypothetical protein